ncbi:MAG: LysM peptidoglycan-binding domain-containing protein [Desulfobacterales bacterium]|jgi:LysM repeat protein
MNDSFYDSSSDDVSKEDYEDEERYRSLEGNNKPTAKRIFVFSALGVSLLVFVIFVVWFMLPGGKSVNSKQFRMLEARVRALEKKLQKLDTINENLIRLENQTKKFAHAIDRFDQFETSSALRMDVLAQELLALQNKKADNKAVERTLPSSEETKADAKKDAQPSRYHVVKAGETLYSISRRYDLSVDALRQFNSLDKNATIYPGQKLVIRSGNSQ